MAYKKWSEYPYPGQSTPPKGKPLHEFWPLVFIVRSGTHVFLDSNQRRINWKLTHPNQVNWESELLMVQQTLASLTPEQKKLAEYWGNGIVVEKVTPIIYRLAEKYNIGAIKLSIVLGYAYAAANDALVMSMYFKYLYNTARPIQYKLNHSAVIHTPPSPSYPSGHAAIAGCLQMVLSHFFPKESAAIKRVMEECAQSRLYAGVHFKADIEAGLKLGKQIGEIVIHQVKI
ncbi:phosphatase PAP2 family protein [Niallia oryzisoli]|uniref:phosphatase PAP2 family protein n=1 Tax=Niallia oryzisoli TaxID=1737571 RepID=UPI0037353A66